MHANMSKKLTDKAAIEETRYHAEDGLIYVHKGSGTLRIAWPDATVEKMTYEQANHYATYIGFVPTPHSSYLA